MSRSLTIPTFTNQSSYNILMMGHDGSHLLGKLLMFNMSLPELNFNTDVDSRVDPKTGAITKVTNRNI